MKVLDEVLNEHLITKEVIDMITVNPINLNTQRQISLDKNAKNKINFEKDLFITQKADPVQSNPLKAIGYNIVKAYNILCTPKRRAAQTESNYIHLPYMA